MIEEYFCSKEFKEILSPLKEEFEEKYEDINVDIIGDIIDISLKYYIIFSHNNKVDVSKLNKFLKYFFKTSFRWNMIAISNLYKTTTSTTTFYKYNF